MKTNQCMVFLDISPLLCPLLPLLSLLSLPLLTPGKSTSSPSLPLLSPSLALLSPSLLLTIPPTLTLSVLRDTTHFVTLTVPDDLLEDDELLILRRAVGGGEGVGAGLVPLPLDDEEDEEDEE